MGQGAGRTERFDHQCIIIIIIISSLIVIASTHVFFFFDFPRVFFLSFPLHPISLSLSPCFHIFISFFPLGWAVPRSAASVETSSPLAAGHVEPTCVAHVHVHVCKSNEIPRYPLLLPAALRLCYFYFPLLLVEVCDTRACKSSAVGYRYIMMSCSRLSNFSFSPVQDRQSFFRKSMSLA